MSDRARPRRGFRLPRLRIARAFGIPIELDASWFLVFALVVFGLSVGYFPVEFPGRPTWVDVTDGVVTAAGFFASIVIHELAHSLVARRQGMQVDRVTLFIFGGVASLREEPSSPRAELQMAAAGPGTSVALSLLSFAIYAIAVALRLPDAVWSPLRYLADVNLLVAGFNLLPGFPMDGGRLARAAIWWATGDRAVASRVAGAGGRLVGFGLIAVGVVGFFTYSYGTLWLAALGLFIERLAAATARGMAAQLRLSGVPAASLSDGDALALPASTPASAVLASVASGGRRVWPVTDGGVVAGMLVIDDLDLASGASDVSVGDLARTDVSEWFVDSADSADTVLRRMTGGAAAVGVVTGGRLSGMISRETMERALRPPSVAP